jgi:hypothetical protein
MRLRIAFRELRTACICTVGEACSYSAVPPCWPATNGNAPRHSEAATATFVTVVRKQRAMRICEEVSSFKPNRINGPDNF